MSAVRARVRAELRARWRAGLALAVLIGLGGGVVLAAAAGARRTDTALPEFLAYHRAPTAAVNFSEGVPLEQREAYYARLAELSSIADVDLGVNLSLRDLGGEGDLEAETSVDGRLLHDFYRPIVVRGRPADPDHPGEATANEALAAARSLEPGDTIEVGLYSAPSFEPSGGPITLQVTGIERQPDDLAADLDAGTDSDEQSQSLFLTPTFVDRYIDADTARSDTVVVRLRDGRAGLEAFRAEVTEVMGSDAIFFGVGEEISESVQRAIRVQANALWIFAALSAVAVLFLVGQTLSRQVALEGEDHRALGALGMTRRQIVAIAAARAALVALAGAALAAAVAVAGSPLTPVGVARRAELSPGVAVDGAVLLVGSLLIVLAVVARTVVSAWWATRSLRLGVGEAEAARVTRTSRTVAGLARVGSPPTVLTGVRMAFERGRGRAAVPVVTAMVTALVGVAAVTAALAFASSLDRLVATPALRGWNWDFQVGPNEEDNAAELLAANPDVAEFSEFGFTPATIDGERVILAGVSTEHGVVSSPVVEGRHPRGGDEIALGRQTLDSLGEGIGDEVVVRIEGFTDESVEARIVGIVVPPAVLVEEMTLGRGAVVTYTMCAELVGESCQDSQASQLVRLAPGADPGQARERLEEDFPDTVQGPTSTSDIDNLGRVSDLPYALAALVALLGVGALAHMLVTSVGRRRTDLAILRTIGFVRCQTTATIAWQATTIAVVAAVVGVPLGLRAGRWAWSLVTGQLGTSPSHVIPAGEIALVVLGVLVVANVVAVLPGRAAARARPAAALRSE